MGASGPGGPRVLRRRGTRAACVPCSGLESVETRGLGNELEVVGHGVRAPGRLGRRGVLVPRIARADGVMRAVSWVNFPSYPWSCQGSITLGDFLSLFNPNTQFIVHLIWNHIFLFNDQPAHW